MNWDTIHTILDVYHKTLHLPEFHHINQAAKAALLHGTRPREEKKPEPVKPAEAPPPHVSELKRRF